jgi:hypothetical protein
MLPSNAEVQPGAPPSWPYAPQNVVHHAQRMVDAVRSVFQSLSTSMEARSQAVGQYFDQFLSNLTCCVSDEAEPEFEPQFEPRFECQSECQSMFIVGLEPGPPQVRQQVDQQVHQQVSQKECQPSSGLDVQHASNKLGLMPELAWLKEARFVSGSVLSLPFKAPIGQGNRHTKENRFGASQPPKMLDFLTLEKGQRGWIKKLEQAVKMPNLHHTIRTRVSEHDVLNELEGPQYKQWCGVHVGDNYLLLALSPLSESERAQLHLTDLGKRAQCMKATVFSPTRKTSFEVIFRELDAEPKKTVSFAHQPYALNLRTQTK